MREYSLGTIKDQPLGSLHIQLAQVDTVEPMCVEGLGERIAVRRV